MDSIPYVGAAPAQTQPHDDRPPTTLETGSPLSVIDALRVVPVVTLDHPEVGPRLAAALRAGGLNLIEVALRSPAAMETIEALTADGRLVVGAGTVLTIAAADAAIAAGARFVVCPGYDPELVRHCRNRDIAVIPGVATASEIQAARRQGLRLVKFFPAAALGGAATITTLSGPFPDMRFLPTGGITLANLVEYLAVPAVVAVGGSWIAPRSLIHGRNWAAITDLARQTRAAIAGSVP